MMEVEKDHYIYQPTEIEDIQENFDNRDGMTKTLETRTGWKEEVVENIKERRSSIDREG